MVKLHLELEGDVGEVFRVLRRLGGGDSAGGEVRDRPRPAPAEERASAVDTVPESGTTATSATLAPGHWTEELAADFTASLDDAARRVMFQVWRAGERRMSGAQSGIRMVPARLNARCAMVVTECVATGADWMAGATTRGRMMGRIRNREGPKRADEIRREPGGRNLRTERFT